MKTLISSACYLFIHQLNGLTLSFYYTYVLFSTKDHKLYIGFTSDVFRRLEEHNGGLNISTATRRPLKLIYFEGHIVKDDALRRESYFKTTSGKRTLEIILKQTLCDLGYQPSTAKE